MATRASTRNTKIAAAFFLALAIQLQAQSMQKNALSFHALPAEWAGDWDGLESLDVIPDDARTLKDDPSHEAVDPLIHSLLTPWGKAKMEATSYDDAPGSLCDPEGWFPFLNYGYGFAMLGSPGKITLIPVEADTEGVRRIYLKPKVAEQLAPAWNGHSVAHWERDTLVIETAGFNDQSWLGDDRERHSTELHLVERMRLLPGGRYLEVVDEVSDPITLTAPYKLKRYFVKYNAAHLGAGPDRNMMELVCNEDPSPFVQKAKKIPEAATPQ